jgi:cytochrome c-type biogenesis protein
MDTTNVTLGLALLAGLASFLSPCVIALVPAYVSYLGGRAISQGGSPVLSRRATFSHGVAFVFGFSAVFVALGAAASVIGGLLFDVRDWISRIGGLVVIIFGLHTLGVLKIPFLNYDMRRQVRPKKSSYLSSGLMGVFFSAGWSPCVGPVLGAVLTLALNGARVEQGVLLLSSYSAGLAIPFLLAALGIGKVTEMIRRHSKVLHYMSIATGVILVIVGIMLFTGTLAQLARFGFFVNFGL